MITFILADGGSSGYGILSFVLAAVLVLTLGIANILHDELREKLKTTEDELGKCKRQLFDAQRHAQEWESYAEHWKNTAERALDEKATAIANAQRDIQRQQARSNPAQSLEDLALIINHKFLNQTRLGRVIEVQFRAIPEGRIEIRWTVSCEGTTQPNVKGYRDGIEIFSAWALFGEHVDQVTQGTRHVYSFQVQRDGNVIEDQRDFCFEVILPTPEQWKRQGMPKPPKVELKEDPVVRRKRRVEEVSNVMEDTVDAISAALNRFETKMRLRGLDEETIQRNLANLQAELTQEMEADEASGR